MFTKLFNLQGPQTMVLVFSNIIVAYLIDRVLVRTLSNVVTPPGFRPWFNQNISFPYTGGITLG